VCSQHSSSNRSRCDTSAGSTLMRTGREVKEKEASTTISRLEQQLKELGEDMEFYKRERDYMAGVILQVPGGDRHFPRPQSPRHRRSSGYSAAGANSTYVQYQESGARSPDSGRHVRRRTSTLSLPHFQPPPPPPPPPPTQTYPPHPPPPSYGQPVAPPPHLGPQQASGPLPSPLPRGTHPAPPPGSQPPPQLMQAAPQTGPWNPYADRRAAQHQQQQHQPQHQQQHQQHQQQHRDSR
jgi:hypothetical protein